MRQGFAVDGSLEVACEASVEVLRAGGTALEAATAGYFAAAMEREGVLLSPASLLLGKSAPTLRAFDGRLRQPGIRGRRPRGFLAGEDIPDAARVAAPRAPQVLLVALAHQPPLRLDKVFLPALELAKRIHRPQRKQILLRAREIGARAFEEASFCHALVASAGPSNGGLLTLGDFELGHEGVGVAPVPAVGDPAARSGLSKARRAELSWYMAPWSNSAPERPIGGAGGEGAEFEPHCLMVGDASGGFVCIEFARALRGLSIPELDDLAPLTATPVLRGVRRVSPGIPIHFGTNAAIGCDARTLTVSVSCRVVREQFELVRDPSSKRGPRAL